MHINKLATQAKYISLTKLDINELPRSFTNERKLAEEL